MSLSQLLRHGQDATRLGEMLSWAVTPPQVEDPRCWLLGEVL